MRVLILATLAILISGCASTYKQNKITNTTSKLDSRKMVIIATPTNGFYGNIKYFDSGRMTVEAVHSAFSIFSNASVSTGCNDLECLQRDNNKKYDYYVIPEILHWEDRATEWSGIVDKIEIKLSVYEKTKMEEISSVVISGESKLATFGGDHPQDLLPKPINKYVESLYH